MGFESAGVVYMVMGRFESEEREREREYEVFVELSS